MFSFLIEKANAQVTTGVTTNLSSDQLMSNILANVVNPLVLLMVGLAVLYFLWGVFQFVYNAESPEERKKGGMNMLWGAIGLFIMVTAYGVLNLIIGTVRTPLGF